MDRIWDTSKYDSKLSVSIFKVKVIQGHEFNYSSNKKKWLALVIHVFRSVFR